MARPGPRALLTPAVDALCAGGASLLLVGALLAMGRFSASPAILGPFVALNVLLNWPHFMGSYQLLYSSPGVLRKHPFAAAYVPAGLIAYATAAALFYSREPLFFYAFHAAASIYLAWHYTGQAWGTMAAFAHVEGTRFDEGARGLARSNLRVLLAWHALWAVHLVAAKAGFSGLTRAYQVMTVAAAASAALGAAALWRFRRAAGRLPATVLLPWLAIHSWYVLIYFYPLALFWVQLAHATQYLLFPLRVNGNRALARQEEPSLESGAGYFVLLIGLGAAAFWAAPWLAERVAAWGASGVPAGLLVIDALNIHHYFVDGCIWKLSNPEVRRELFAHLEAAPAASPATAGAVAGA